MEKSKLLEPVRVHATQLFINGQFVDAKTGKTFPVVNPCNGEVIANIHEGGAEDADLAVQAARKAFDEGPWKTMSAYDRSLLIYKLADLIEKNLDELVVLESMDNGKPVSVMRAIDFAVVLQTLRYFAGWADKIHGLTIPMSGDCMAYTRQEPVGVVAAIIPWNFPALMLAWKIAPALAAGCTVVLKPAEQTPLSALRIAELINEAGFPPGVVNIVPGYGPTVGKALAQHHLVDKVAFTGSTEVGYEIMRSSHVRNLKRITLELGGKSPCIVMDDADLDTLAIDVTQFATFANSGQSCVAAQRIYVHEKIYDEFVQRTIEATQKQKVGDALDPESEYGPIIDEEQFNKVVRYIEQAQQEGAKLLTGGKRLGDKGFFMEPAVLVDLTDDMTILKEEVFGPVMTILKFSTLEEVIKRANNTNYGLGAGVVTRSLDTAMIVANSVKAGSVYINCYDTTDASTPFGGFKDSGLGRELGERGLQQYLETKTVIIKRPDGCPK